MIVITHVIKIYTFHFKLYLTTAVDFIIVCKAFIVSCSLYKIIAVFNKNFNRIPVLARHSQFLPC